MKDTVLPKKKTSIKPTGDFDQRFSVFGSNKNVNIWGYRIGVLVNDKIKVGIGGYFVKSDYDTNIYKTRNQTQNFTQKSQINQTIYYGTMYLEPYLIRKKHWELSMLFEAGLGNVTIDSFSLTKKYANSGGRLLSTDSTIKTGKESIVPIGMGFTLNLIIPDMKGLHFLTYLGLNCILGIRTVIKDSDFKQSYDGVFWSVGSAIFIDRIFTDIAKRKKTVKSIPK